MAITQTRGVVTIVATDSKADLRCGSRQCQRSGTSRTLPSFADSNQTRTRPVWSWITQPVL